MQQRFHAWLLDRADEAILRWIFRSIVMVTIAVLAVDLATMQGWIANPGPASTPAEIELGSPALNFPSLPSVLAPWLPGGDKRLVPLPQPDGIMAQPMTFELVSSGKGKHFDPGHGRVMKEWIAFTGEKDRWVEFAREAYEFAKKRS